MQPAHSLPAIKRLPIDKDATLGATTARLLGLSERQCSDLGLASRTEKGLPISVIHSLRARLGLTDEELYQLIAPRRTLNRRETARQPLSRDESDRAARLARLGAHALHIFSREPGYALEWMRKAQLDLGNRSPLQLAATEPGARAVEEMLLGLEHGIFA